VWHLFKVEEGYGICLLHGFDGAAHPVKVALGGPARNSPGNLVSHLKTHHRAIAAGLQRAEAEGEDSKSFALSFLEEDEKVWNRNKQTKIDQYVTFSKNIKSIIV
jgi:hypothetical protein